MAKAVRFIWEMISQLLKSWTTSFRKMHRKGERRSVKIFFLNISIFYLQGLLLHSAWNTDTANSLSNLFRSWYTHTSIIQLTILLSHVGPKIAVITSHGTWVLNRRQNQTEMMKNVKTDKIYLSLTNLKNTDFSPALCQEHCTDEYTNIFLYYYVGTGGGGEKEKRVSVQVQVFFSINIEKRWCLLRSLLLLKCHGILGSWQQRLSNTGFR